RVVNAISSRPEAKRSSSWRSVAASAPGTAIRRRNRSNEPGLLMGHLASLLLLAETERGLRSFCQRLCFGGRAGDRPGRGGRGRVAAGDRPLSPSFPSRRGPPGGGGAPW